MKNCYSCRFAIYHPETSGSIIHQQPPEEAWFQCRPPSGRESAFPAHEVDDEDHAPCPLWAPKQEAAACQDALAAMEVADLMSLGEMNGDDLPFLFEETYQYFDPE